MTYQEWLKEKWIATGGLITQAQAAKVLGCSITYIKTSEASTETKETQTSEEKTADDLPEQLQAIVNDYSKKMEEKTPVLIEEYQTEIQGNQEGIAGLSAVANQKARELQAISDEGIGKLRAAYQSADNKDGVALDTLINQL